MALAREVAASGDRIAAENLYQHAEHYFRLMNTNGDATQVGIMRPATPADTDPCEPDEEASENNAPDQQSLPIMPSESQTRRY
jgi:histone deacetylase complex regulatory component SIN3